MKDKTLRNKYRRANRRVRPSYFRNGEGNLVREDGFILSRAGHLDLAAYFDSLRKSLGV